MATKRSRIGHRLLLKMGLRREGTCPTFDVAHENYTWLKHYVEEMRESLSAYALQVRRCVSCVDVCCFDGVGWQRRLWVICGGCFGIVWIYACPSAQLFREHDQPECWRHGATPPPQSLTSPTALLLASSTAKCHVQLLEATSHNQQPRYRATGDLFSFLSAFPQFLRLAGFVGSCRW